MTKLIVWDGTNGRQSCIDVNSWDSGVSLVGQDVVKSESLWGMGVGAGVERGCLFSVPWG